MFIFLSKLLPLFAYPLGLACVLLFFALLAGRKSKTGMVLVILALLILWLSSTTGFSTLLARSLEWRFTPQDKIPASDAIVLVGGGTEPAASPRPSVEINSAGDRVLYAARLYREGKAPTILLSGGEISWLNEGASTPAEDMAELLSFMGVPAEAMLVETESRNTYENALFAHEMLEEMGLDRIILVTSAMHMPRASAAFEKQGFEVLPAPVDYSVTENESAEEPKGALVSKILDIIPTASSLALTTNAIKEYIGLLVYRLQGWL